MSRIAYTEDPMPLFLVSGVLQIIPPEIIAGLATISDVNFKIEDDVLFDLIANPNGFKLREYTESNGSKRKAILDITATRRKL